MKNFFFGMFAESIIDWLLEYAATWAATTPSDADDMFVMMFRERKPHLLLAMKKKLL